MFKIFKKKRDEVVDLVSLQKRGIIPQSVDAKQPVTSISDSSSPDSPSALGFLGNLATASSDSESSSSYDTDSSYNSGLDSSGYLDYSRRKARLKTRILDMQEKINKHGDELYDIKNILEAIEKRIGRLERKSGLKDFEKY